MRLLLGSLQVIERVGNKLPHPFWLFTIMAGIVIALSALLNAMGVSAVSPVDGERIAVRSLLSPEGVQTIVGDAIDNFATFPPLAIIIVVMLGVSVAERSGLLNAMLRGSVTRVPARWLTFAVALTGITGSVASDAAYVVLIPLGALLFKAAGRSPVLGLVVAFGSVSAGYNASLLITPTDALLAALSTEAASIIDPGYTVTALDNYFFSVVSAVVLAALITLVTEFLLSRGSGGLAEDGDGDGEGDREAQELGSMTLSDAERRGLRDAGLTVLAAVAVLAVALVPPASPLRGEDGTVLGSPIITGVAYVLGVLFLLAGVVYGRATGTVASARDVPEAMTAGVRDLAPVVVLFFAASQFLAYFRWTGIGEIVAIRGAALLDSAGVHPLVLFLGMIVFSSLLNLLITSGSAQWTLIAPVFVPMFMLLDVPPETTQAVYRIADSSTNVISPMSPYFVMALGFLQRYRRDAGIGTLISLTLPLCLTVLVGWTLLFLGWWALDIPLGPGVPVR
ncbi:AbgT family transporter [Nocardiopsis dassonvillei]|uniref:AbgT family transporter n=1 Tax=Nocardiopsis dassonvillei TaxID=2014 RepID=UPI00157D2E1B|nr:AbgT family transporter [Nocardiopsis dassonvillei]